MKATGLSISFARLIGDEEAAVGRLFLVTSNQVDDAILVPL
jgi:hypothetical protein